MKLIIVRNQPKTSAREADVLGNFPPQGGFFVGENMKTYKYTIYRPSGNDTALVERLILKPALKKQINNAIMVQSPAVEQVGFIDKKKMQLEMAGGEFCGNATRCAAYQFLNGRYGEILIKVSGVNRRLKAGIDRSGNSWAQMPVYSDSRKLTKNKDCWIVELEGITQVVCERKDKFTSKDKAKKKGLEILERLNLTESVPAAGVMFLTKTNGQFSIEPIVWVRDIKTLFYETACASGTAAVGVVTALKSNKSVDSLQIFQPTNLPIFVSVDFKNNKFKEVSIKGPVTVFFRNISISI